MSELFIVPPGRKTGALYRTSKFGGVCSIWGEKMEVLSASEIEEAIAARQLGEVDGRDSTGPIFDQDGVGSCAAEACTQGVQSTRKRQNLPFVQLSPWFLYHHSSGGVDRGSSLDTNLEYARDIGIASMAVWPRDKGWRDKPSNEAYADALQYRLTEFYDVGTISEVQTALVKGFFVQFGHDSHSELFVDILSMTTGKVANSWSTGWGDGGYHDFSFSRINWGYGCFAFRAVQ
jgi:hypothetical protein